jgi:DNA-binding response OmpR family regulator
MKIIVAEDDRVLSLMYCGILKEGGHMAVPAYDSMQTLMFTMKQQPDLVLLDINMPGGTGVDVLKKLKANAKTSQVPVVVISGSKDAQHPAQVLALGAKQFLSKPVEPDALLAAVREAVL